MQFGSHANICENLIETHPLPDAPYTQPVRVYEIARLGGALQRHTACICRLGPAMHAPRPARQRLWAGYIVLGCLSSLHIAASRPGWRIGFSLDQISGSDALEFGRAERGGCM